MKYANTDPLLMSAVVAVALIYVVLMAILRKQYIKSPTKDLILEIDNEQDSNYFEWRFMKLVFKWQFLKSDNIVIKMLGVASVLCMYFLLLVFAMVFLEVFGIVSANI